MSDQYNEFFERANSSIAFSKYCTDVYNVDLTQDGFSDQRELDKMIEVARISSTDTVLDIGCGNGKIDEYINSKTAASITGIDNSVSAVSHAQKISNNVLRFFTGDINTLVLERNYDVIILIDSIYFSNDYDRTLQHLYGHLAEGGRLVLMYSEFLFNKDEQRRLGPHDTKIAETIKKNNWRSSNEDLTQNLFQLMRKKRIASEDHRTELESEGNQWLFKKIHDESVELTMSYSDFEKFTNRFIYCIEKSEVLA